MKTFLAVFFAILAAAAVIGGFIHQQGKRTEARLAVQKAAEAKILEARLTALRTLDFLTRTENDIYEEPIASRVESFGRVYRLSTNSLPILPPAERAEFLEAANRKWTDVVARIADDKELLRSFPPILEADAQ